MSCTHIDVHHVQNYIVGIRRIVELHNMSANACVQVDELRLEAKTVNQALSVLSLMVEGVYTHDSDLTDSKIWPGHRNWSASIIHCIIAAF